MSRLLKIAITILACLAGVWLAYRQLNQHWLEPRRLKVQQIAAATANLNMFAKAAPEARKAKAAIQALGDRTLGGDYTIVDHNLRTRLSRICEHLRFSPQNFSVETERAARKKDSPGKTEFRDRRLREEIDYEELDGWINATGTFEQALRLVDAIESEPWIKRINQLTLDPKENGAKFAISLRLTTVFLPSVPPKGMELPAPGNSPHFERYAALVRTNPFRVPPPPPPVAPDPKPSTDVAAGPAKSAFPYDQWSLTGIAQNGGSAEIWLLNQKTRESRRLAVGEHLQDVILVAASGERAEFRSGEQRFTVDVGRNMSDRAPLNQ